MADLNPDEAASSFSRALLARGGRGSGVPPPPMIEVSETALDLQRIGFKLDGEPESQAGVLMGGGGIIPTPVGPTVCSGVSLMVDVVSASRSKCGFSYASKIWLRKECSYTGTSHQFPPATSFNASCSAMSQLEYNTSDDCATLTNTCSGTSSSDFTPSNGLTWHLPSGGSLCEWASGTSDPGYPVHNICAVTTCKPGSGERLENMVPSENCTDSANRATCSISESITIVFSVEYTTALLKSKTVASLPAFDDDFDDSPASSLRDLSPDESSLTIRRIKYKFHLASLAPSGDCVVSYNLITKDEGGTIIGTESNFVTIPAGSSDSGVFLLNEPESNGTIEVVIV